MPFSAVVVAVTALVGVTALVAHDAFFAKLGIQPEDAGASDLEIVVRGMVYTGLALVCAAAAAALGAAGWLVRRRTRLAVAAAILTGGVTALLVSSLLFGGLREFGLATLQRGVGIVILALLVSAVVTCVLIGVRTGDERAAVIALLLMALAAIPSVLLARAGGQMLAERVLNGQVVADDPDRRLELRPGPFDPLQMRAQSACILPRGGSPEQTAPARKYVLLGQSAGAPLLYDFELRRAFHVPAERLGVLGPASDVCRRPGDSVPVETSTPAEDAALARLYRPVLRFDSREPWRPLNVETLVSEVFEPGARRHQICAGKTRCSDLQSSAELVAQRDRLDIHGSGVNYRAAAHGRCPGRAPLLDCEDSTSAIYYYVRREDRRAYVDYWWFFRFNHFPLPVRRGATCGGPPTPGSQHEGDWEGVTVVTAFNRPDRIDYVAFSSHGHSVRYPKRVVALDGGTMRPQVYVACGSHAAYPRPCAGPKSCRQTAVRCGGRACRRRVSGLAEGPYDGGAAWHRNSDAACFPDPPTPKGHFPQDEPPPAAQSACLIPLPSTPTSGVPRPAEWTDWPGRWGVSHGPRSPAAQGRYRRPWEMVPSRRARFGRTPEPGEAPKARSDDGKPGPGSGPPAVVG